MHTHLFVTWWYLQEHWPTILAYLGTSGVISTLIQYAKKKLSVEDKKKILAAVGALSFIPDAINTLASNPSWAAFLPSNFSWIFTGSVAIHAFFVSPVWKKTAVALRPYLQAVQEIKAQDSALSNPNLTLNTPTPVIAPTPPQTEQSPEDLLVVQG